MSPDTNAERVFRDLGEADYVVINGQHYSVYVNDYGGAVYLEEVDGIPEWYKERWE